MGFFLDQGSPTIRSSTTGDHAHRVRLAAAVGQGKSETVLSRPEGTRDRAACAKMIFSSL